MASGLKVHSTTFDALNARATTLVERERLDERRAAGRRYGSMVVPGVARAVFSIVEGRAAVALSRAHARLAAGFVIRVSDRSETYTALGPRPNQIAQTGYSTKIASQPMNPSHT
jgi:hypothetical protein